jgi:hypothetical protein
VTLTSTRSPNPPPPIERLMVIVQNDRYPDEGRRVRRTLERALEERKIVNRCIYVPRDLEAKWVDLDVERFKPHGILRIQLVGIVVTEMRAERWETQYDASLYATAFPDRRIWRGKAVARERFDPEARDRSDKIAKRIVAQLVEDRLVVTQR